MNKFVKIAGYEGWFLFMESEIDMDQVINFNKRSHESIISKYLKSPDDESVESKVLESKAKFLMHHNVGINYNQVFRKYGGTLLIREIGSWMLFHDQKITDVTFSEHFSWPVDSKSNIIICENDFEPEQWWVNYLSNRFPNESISTLNCFSQRTIDDLKDNLDYPKFITFTTTFSKLEWFENLINTIQYYSGRTLIVHWKGTDEVWENVRLEFQTQIENFERNNKLEIVKF